MGFEPTTFCMASSLRVRAEFQRVPRFPLAEPILTKRSRPRGTCRSYRMYLGCTSGRPLIAQRNVLGAFFPFRLSIRGSSSGTA